MSSERPLKTKCWFDLARSETRLRRGPEQVGDALGCPIMAMLAPLTGASSQRERPEERSSQKKLTPGVQLQIPRIEAHRIRVLAKLAGRGPSPVHRPEQIVLTFVRHVTPLLLEH